MDPIVEILKALAEPTRLRVLLLVRRAELTLSEIAQILGQSQPRLHRHLKALTESQLILRSRDGVFALHRYAAGSEAAALAEPILARLPTDSDPLLKLDAERLTRLIQQREAAAAAWFDANAGFWHRLRSLHVPEKEVEAALLALLEPGERLGRFLDIGTGTGRMLELFAPHARDALGIDKSRAMLEVARATLERSGLTHCAVRAGEMHQLPLPSGSVDLAVMHQVLHFAADPAAAIAEAARVLVPGGRLAIVDFLEHGEQALLQEHAHLWPGFAPETVSRLMAQAGLIPKPVLTLPGQVLTVLIWTAQQPTSLALRSAA